MSPLRQPMILIKKVLKPDPKKIMFKIRPYQNEDLPAVVELWRACGLTVPHNDPMKDVQRKMVIQPDLFLVGIHKGCIIATVMAGYEGHRGWLNYLAVSADMRRKGIARLMVSEAEKRLRLLGCPKINVQVRTSNAEAVAFYRRLGFSEDKVISLGKRLKVD